MRRPPDEELARLGESLREIDPSALQQDEEGSSIRWFLGANGTELYAWTRQDAAAPHHVQLVFARVSVEWRERDGLVTGNFKSGSTTSGGRYDPYLLTVGNTVDPEVCSAALVLLRSAPIDTAVRDALVRPLEEAMAARAAAP